MGPGNPQKGRVVVERQEDLLGTSAKDAKDARRDIDGFQRRRLTDS